MARFTLLYYSVIGIKVQSTNTFKDEQSILKSKMVKLHVIFLFCNHHRRQFIKLETCAHLRWIHMLNTYIGESKEGTGGPDPNPWRITSGYMFP